MISFPNHSTMSHQKVHLVGPNDKIIFVKKAEEKVIFRCAWCGELGHTSAMHQCGSCHSIGKHPTHLCPLWTNIVVPVQKVVVMKCVPVGGILTARAKRVSCGFCGDSHTTDQHYCRCCGKKGHHKTRNCPHKRH